MPTLKTFVKLARISAKDKTSGARARQIAGILRRHHITQGLTPEKAVALLEDLGPTFVKIGQVASNRSDLFPAAYCEALHNLRAHVSPMPFSQVKTIIEQAYGKPLDEVFASFDEQPLGSASIAQVHRAALPGGEAVAVKVRRPGIEKQMTDDLVLMRHLLTLAEFSVAEDAQTGMLLSASSLLDELERITAEELDFSVETANLVRFRAITDRQAGVTSPLPHPELTRPDVLVMEFVRGTSITEAMPVARANGAERGTDARRASNAVRDADIAAFRAELGERMARSYVEQVVDEGFFHADPHPGNVLVRDGELVWIDLGMTGRLGAAERTLVAEMFTAMAASDPVALKDALLALAGGGGDGVNHARLLGQISAMLARYGSADLATLDIGKAFSDVTEVMRSQGLTLPSSVTMLGRGFLTLEGVLAEVAPQTNLVGLLEEHVKRQLASVRGLRERASKIAMNAVVSAEAMVRLPKQASDTLDMLDRGELRMATDLRFSREFRTMAYTVSGLLADALISAGLFVGSSVLCTTDLAPKFFGVPLLGVLGYVGAGVLGTYAVWLAWRTRHKAHRGDA